MKKPVSVAVAGMLLFGLTACADSNDESFLREFKTEMWPRAYRTQDVELLDRMLHESFVVISDTGDMSTKQGELEWIAANQWDPGEFEYRIERLDIYGGETAIISGQGIAENYSYRSSNVLIKENGRWQAVSSHVSGFELTDAQPSDAD